MKDKNSSYARLWEQLKRYVTLNIEYAKLTLAEKLTVFITVMAVCAIALLLSVIVLFFVSVAIAELLATALPVYWAYLIVAGFYIVLFVVLFVLRKQLVMNPVARFISHLILK